MTSVVPLGLGYIVNYLYPGTGILILCHNQYIKFVKLFNHIKIQNVNYLNKSTGMQCNVIDGIIDLKPVNSYKLQKRISSCYLERGYITDVMKFTKQQTRDVCILKEKITITTKLTDQLSKLSKVRLMILLDLQNKGQVICQKSR